MAHYLLIAYLLMNTKSRGTLNEIFMNDHYYSNNECLRTLVLNKVQSLNNLTKNQKGGGDSVLVEFRESLDQQFDVMIKQESSAK